MISCTCFCKIINIIIFRKLSLMYELIIDVNVLDFVEWKYFWNLLCTSDWGWLQCFFVNGFCKAEEKQNWNYNGFHLTTWFVGDKTNKTKALTMQRFSVQPICHDFHVLLKLSPAWASSTPRFYSHIPSLCIAFVAQLNNEVVPKFQAWLGTSSNSPAGLVHI